MVGLGKGFAYVLTSTPLEYYTGPEGTPTFTPGVYPDQINALNEQLDTVTVTIVGVPEPSTWAMMLIGFASLGLAGYRSRIAPRMMASRQSQAAMHRRRRTPVLGRQRKRVGLPSASSS